MSAKQKPEYLQSMTFYDFCKHHVPHVDVDLLINIFGYRCEFDLLNAYDARRTFAEDFSGQRFFVLVEGLSRLCQYMAEDFQNNGGTLHLGQKVADIEYASDQSVLVHTTSMGIVACDRVVVAVKPHQMKAFSVLRPVHDIMDHVSAGKLLRVYAQFPANADGEPWFKGMKRTTTNSFLRHIIPISEKSGLIMISYTDGSDVDHFLTASGELRTDVRGAILAECARLFGSIPKPTYFKCHYWSEGCHYWRPTADSDRVSKTMVNPVRNVYTCGEGFSTRQCWIEGALISASLVTAKLEATRQVRSKIADAKSLALKMLTFCTGPGRRHQSSTISID